MDRLLVRFFAATATAAALVALLAGPAGAHAEIRDADPRPGDTVAAGLDELELSFISLDPTLPVEVEVLDEAGADVAVGAPEVSERDLVVTVAVEPLTAGTWEVRWRGTSDDGDGASFGSYTFEVEPAPGTPWVLWAAVAAVPLGLGVRSLRRRVRS